MSEPRRHPAFRSARPASAAWNVAKTAFHSALFWLVFLGAGPWLLVRLEHALGLAPWQFPGQRALATVLFAAFGALNLTSGLVMARHGRGTPLPLDMANELVVVGPYRHVRNPMALGGLGAGFALGLGLGSTFTITYAIAGGVIWDAFVRPIEERDLHARFGEPYARYRDALRCWWPRLRPYDGAAPRIRL
ncbi:methyltransferase family protein [Nannocystis radixulma]|uniref:Methyltransferase n=1 Tax=Nannocystis radixulma TaxID=2995305 RepID=A0ABT5AYT8_9BACT|nr:methyltransferase [Nannocystis radixulma]MDC0667009.1 methyltransferase [Nannocystis radixulma]